VIRRRLRIISILLLFFLFLHTLSAQVYPDREELDVVRLVDGTVLKGVILEQVPERYLEIELYGGSTFVLGYEQIESVEREANPDYGMAWIKVELGADSRVEADGSDEVVPEATQETEDRSPETATDRKGRPFLGHGWLVGPSLTVGRADFYGDDWDATLDAYDVDSRWGAIFGTGVHAGYLAPFPSGGVRGSFWGGRGGIELALINSGFDAGERTAYGEKFDSYSIRFTALSMPVEALIGYGGSRLLGYLGAGTGVVLIVAEPDNDWRPDKPPVENNTFDFPEFANPWQPFVQVSTGSIVRLGSRVSLDARVFWQWHLTSIFADTEQNFMITPGLSLGVAWHRKEA